MARFKDIAKAVTERTDVIRALLVRDYCPSDFVPQATEGCRIEASKFCPIIFGHDSRGCEGCWSRNMVGWEGGKKGYVALPTDILEHLPMPHGDSKPKPKPRARDKAANEN